MRNYSNYTRDSLKILYYMSDLCNFKCDYCYRNPYKENSYEPTIEDIDNLIKHLKSDNFKINDFKIIGGEPSINNKTFYLIDKVANELNVTNKIIIASNSSNFNFFVELKEKNIPKLSLNLTYHPKYDNIRNDYDWFLNNFDEVYISCVLDKRYEKNLFKFLDKYKNYKKLVPLKVVNNPELVEDSLLKTEFSDINFCKRVAKHLNISLQEFLFSARVNNIYRNRLCYNNVIKIEPNGKMSYSGCHNDFLITTNIYKSPYIHKEYPIVCNKVRIFGDCLNCVVNYHE